MAQRRNDRIMIIFPSGTADAGRLTHWRVAPFRRDQQRRGDNATVLQADRDTMFLALDLGGLCLPHQPDVLARFGPAAQRRAEVPIFVHPAKWLIILARVEGEAARSETIRNLDPADWAAWHREMVDNADRVEHPLRRRRKSAGAAVKGRILMRFGIGRIDHKRRNTATGH